MEFFIREAKHSRMMLAGLAFALAATVTNPAHGGNSVGWVWGNTPNATSAYTPDPSHSYNSTGGSIAVVPISTGYYEVEFGSLYDGAPSNVLVSAYDTSGSCVPSGWSASGATVDAYVSCVDATGNPANTYFTLLYQSRKAPTGNAGKGLAFLLADQPFAKNYTPDKLHQYNSAGKINTIKRYDFIGGGGYLVTIPGLTATGGDVQVTAYGGGRCNIVSWSSNAEGTTVNVDCSDPKFYDGLRTNESFLLAYAIDKPFGFTEGTNPRGAWVFANQAEHWGSYTPDTNYQYNGFSPGKLTVAYKGMGQYTVTIPGSRSYTNSIAIVTANSNNGWQDYYCNVAGWEATSVNVACYSHDGKPSPAGFDLTFQAAGR
jgi:hypothetical protein